MGRHGKRSVNICIVDLREELQILCEDCLKELGKGFFAVGIVDGERKFLVEHNPSIECCKKVRSVPLLYMDEASAIQKQQEIIETVKIDNDLSSLILEDVTGGLITNTRH